MLTDEVKNSVKGLSKEDIIAKMSSGEIVPPAKGSPERDEFMKFVSMNPEEREKSFTETTDGTPAGSDNNDAGKGPEPEVKPWWVEDGFTDEKSAVTATRELRNLNSALQNSIDQLNAKEGKRGQETKRLREDVERLTRERDDLLEKNKTAKKELVKPTKPNPNDYEDGRLDERFQEDMDKYFQDMEEYNHGFVTTKIEETTSQFTSKINELDSKIRSAPAQSSEMHPLERVFKSELPDFQKKFGLEMSISAWDMNNLAHELKSSDPVIKARAEQKKKTLSPADYEKWSKVVTALNSSYDFSEGEPVSKGYKSFEGALFDQGLLDGFKSVTPTRLSPEEEKRLFEQKKNEQQGSIAVPPAAGSASQDQLPTGELTREEKTKRLRDLNTKYQLVINKAGQQAFEASQEYQEYLRLRTELYGAPRRG